MKRWIGIFLLLILPTMAMGQYYSVYDSIATGKIFVGSKLPNDTITKGAVVIDTVRAVVYYNRGLVWDDIIVSGSSFGTGVTAPTMTLYGGSTTTRAMGFQGSTANDIGHWGLQYTHRYNIGDSAGVHYHWTRDSLVGTPPGVNDSIIFVSKYFWQNIDSTQGTEVIDTLRLRARDISAWQHKLAEPPMQAFSRKSFSSVMTGSIQRLQDHPNDNYSGWSFITSTDAHYKINSDGSREEYVK